MKEWDNGYLVVMTKYKYNNKTEEEYVDVKQVADTEQEFQTIVKELRP